MKTLKQELTSLLNMVWIDPTKHLEEVKDHGYDGGEACELCVEWEIYRTDGDNPTYFLSKIVHSPGTWNDPPETDVHEIMQGSLSEVFLEFLQQIGKQAIESHELDEQIEAENQAQEAL